MIFKCTVKGVQRVGDMKMLYNSLKLFVAVGFIVLVAAACRDKDGSELLAEKLTEKFEAAFPAEEPEPEPSNSPPEVLEGQEFDVDENSPAGTAVGTVVATDIDGDPLSYSITGGAGRGDFTIDPNDGLMSVVNPPDFEERPDYFLTVEVSDGLATDDAEVIIHVNDLLGATIAGGVFADLNVNGVLDDGEPPISGATVTLTLEDSNTETATDGSGEYIFEVFVPGVYRITETDPERYDSTNAIPGSGAAKIDANTLEIDSIAGDDILNQIHFSDNMFLDTVAGPTVYTITGWVWEDINRDGFFDMDEPGLAGTVVALSSGLTQTTASDGQFMLYSADELITVTATHPDGYTPTNAIPGDGAFINDNVTLVVDVGLLGGDRTSSDNLFGASLPLVETTISGTVFDDADCNGVFDGGDTGVQGVSVALETQGGDTVNVNTNVDGYYEFILDLDPYGGGENVRITSSGPGGGFFATTLESVVFSVNPGGEYPNNNFGYSDGCPTPP
jgi:hypothetical protein